MAIRVTDPAELPLPRLTVLSIFKELWIVACLLWFGGCTGLVVATNTTTTDAVGLPILFAFTFAPLLIRYRGFFAGLFARAPVPAPPPDPEPEPEIDPEAILLGKTLDQEDRQGAQDDGSIESLKNK